MSQKRRVNEVVEPSTLGKGKVYLRFVIHAQSDNETLSSSVGMKPTVSWSSTLPSSVQGSSPVAWSMGLLFVRSVIDSNRGKIYTIFRVFPIRSTESTVSTIHRFVRKLWPRRPRSRTQGLMGSCEVGPFTLGP